MFSSWLCGFPLGIQLPPTVQNHERCVDWRLSNRPWVGASTLIWSFSSFPNKKSKLCQNKNMTMVNKISQWLLLGNEQWASMSNSRWTDGFRLSHVVGFLKHLHILISYEMPGQAKCTDKYLIVERILFCLDVTFSPQKALFLQEIILSFDSVEHVTWCSDAQKWGFVIRSTQLSHEKKKKCSLCQLLAAGHKKGNFCCFQLLKTGNSHESDGAIIPLCKLGKELGMCSDQAFFFPNKHDQHRKMKRTSDDRTWKKMNEKKTKACLWIISPNSSNVSRSLGNKFLLFWQSLQPGKTVSCAPDCKRGDTKISNQEEIVLRLGSKGCLCKLLKAKKHTFCCVYIHSNSREGKRSLIESTHVSFMHVWFHFLGGKTTVVERERDRLHHRVDTHRKLTERGWLRFHRE